MIISPKTTIEQVLEVAERIRQQLQQAEFEVAGGITCSVGVGYLDKSDCAISFFERADNALYKAKTTAKNQVCC